MKNPPAPPSIGGRPARAMTLFFNSPRPPHASMAVHPNPDTVPMRLALLVAALALPVALRAQPTASPARVVAEATLPPAVRERMQPLGWLVGEWQGSGWIAQGREGVRTRFTQKEWVRWAAGGGVLVIDGLGTGAEGEAAGAVVHQAFATLLWDADSAAYRMRSYRAGGAEGSDVPVVSDGRFVWGIKVPGGRIRFTITRTAAGEWHEVGEWVRDGAPPDAKAPRMMEMTLKRVR